MTAAGVWKRRTGAQNARRPAPQELYGETRVFPEESLSDFYVFLSLFCKREAKGEVKGLLQAAACV